MASRPTQPQMPAHNSGGDEIPDSLNVMGSGPDGDGDGPLNTATLLDTLSPVGSSRQGGTDVMDGGSTGSSSTGSIGELIQGLEGDMMLALQQEHWEQEQHAQHGEHIPVDGSAEGEQRHQHQQPPRSEPHGDSGWGTAMVDPSGHTATTATAINNSNTTPVRERGGARGRRRRRRRQDSGYQDEMEAAVVEIGHYAVWSVSSAKPGNGVRQLRDGRHDTFWQAEGNLPHFVTAQFHRRMHIAQVRILLDYTQDESYTPSQISIRYGTGWHDLREAQMLQLVEPQGWIKAVFLTGKEKEQEQGRGEEDGAKHRKHAISCRVLQLAVLANHQNGRDSNIRQIEIYSSPDAHHQPISANAGHPMLFDGLGGLGAGFSLAEERFSMTLR